MEINGKCIKETSTSKWVDIKDRLYLLTQAIFGKLVLLIVTQNNCLFAILTKLAK